MPKTKSMMPGHIVTIYHDPITRTKVEGKAVLVKSAGLSPDYISDTQRIEYWLVKFPGERTAYQREILTDVH